MKFIRIKNNYLFCQGEEIVLDEEMYEEELIRLGDLLKVYKLRGNNTPVIAYLFRCRGIEENRIYCQAFQSFEERDYYFNLLEEQLTGGKNEENNNDT